MFKHFATLSLVFLTLIAIWLNTASSAIARELYPESARTAEITGKSHGVSSIADIAEEKKFTFPPKNGVLAEVNQKFHEDYDRLIAQITSTFGKPGGPTVLLFTTERLVIYHNGMREEQEFIPPLYHQLKAIAHHPITLYAILQSYEGENLTDFLRNFLRQRSNLLQKSLKSLTEQNWLPNIVENQKSLLHDSIEYINLVLEKGRINREDLNKYVYSVHPKILLSVHEAAAAELELINEKVKNLLGREKWRSPYIVICSVHQARHGEVVTQYFEQMFNEFQGDAAEREERIVFAESILGDETKALRLLATHILDRKIAGAFFRDPRRLQSDALMNDANFWLWEHRMDIPQWR